MQDQIYRRLAGWISEDLVSALESGEISVNSEDGTGLSFLGLLCQQDIPQAIKILVEDLGSDPLRRDGRGLTAVEHAVLAGSPGVLDYLLSRYPEVRDQVNPQGETLQELAAQSEGPRDLILQIISHGTIPVEHPIKEPVPLDQDPGASHSDSRIQNQKIYQQPPYGDLWKTSVIQAAREDLTGALETLVQLTHQLPQEPDLWKSRAHIHVRLGEYPQALTAVQKALGLRTDPQIQLLQASVLLLLRRDQEAAQVLGALDPALFEDEDTQAEVLAYQAILAARQGNPDQARERARQSHQADPYGVWEGPLEEEFQGLLAAAGILGEE